MVFELVLPEPGGVPVMHVFVSRQSLAPRVHSTRLTGRDYSLLTPPLSSVSVHQEEKRAELAAYKV